jgi:signal peptidase I
MTDSSSNPPIASTVAPSDSSPATLDPPPVAPPPVARPRAAADKHIIYPSPLETVRSLLSIIVIALFALTFILQPFRIPSESMERTLLVGDFLLVNKMIYGPPGKWTWLLPYRRVQAGDIVVFHFPIDPADHVVKRVIGLPGDRIHLHDGVVYRNGQPVTEPYAVYESAYSDSFRDQFPAVTYTDPGVDTHWWQEMRHDEINGDLVVPAGEYFVLGDNRNHSRDSRYWGFVPRAAIVGRPFIVYFSLRQPSTTDLPELPQVTATQPPDDKLGHRNSALNRLANFARWDRMLRIVR